MPYSDLNSYAQTVIKGWANLTVKAVVGSIQTAMLHRELKATTVVEVDDDYLECVLQILTEKGIIADTSPIEAGTKVEITVDLKSTTEEGISWVKNYPI